MNNFSAWISHLNYATNQLYNYQIFYNTKTTSYNVSQHMSLSGQAQERKQSKNHDECD